MNPLEVLAQNNSPPPPLHRGRTFLPVFFMCNKKALLGAEASEEAVKEESPQNGSPAQVWVLGNTSRSVCSMEQIRRNLFSSFKFSYTKALKLEYSHMTHVNPTSITVTVK